MRCPYCKTDDDRVIDSRSIGEGATIRRRRECLSCEKRFTTYERTEVAPLRVVKKDGSFESFDRDKILRGVTRACEKRNLSLAQLEGSVSRIEARILEKCDIEVSTKQIGEIVSEELRDLDHVAYVRFASVYREFKDIEQFLQEILAVARPELVEPLRKEISGNAEGKGRDRKRGGEEALARN